jgi:hypothetical protein
MTGGLSADVNDTQFDRRNFSSSRPEAEFLDVIKTKIFRVSSYKSGLKLVCNVNIV